MRWALGKILSEEAAFSESYYHVARQTRREGYRALCNVGLGWPLAGMWGAEVSTEEAVRRLRAARLPCPHCPTMLEDWRDPVTRLGEIGLPA